MVGDIHIVVIFVVCEAIVVDEQWVCQCRVVVAGNGELDITSSWYIVAEVV